MKIDLYNKWVRLFITFGTVMVSLSLFYGILVPNGWDDVFQIPMFVEYIKYTALGVLAGFLVLFSDLFRYKTRLMGFRVVFYLLDIFTGIYLTYTLTDPTIHLHKSYYIIYGIVGLLLVSILAVIEKVKRHHEA